MSANVEELQKSPIYQETLTTTKNRQYRSRGLMHIQDNMYEFFLELETLRVENLNNAKLRRMKEDVIDCAIKAALDSNTLQSKCYKCFPKEETNQVSLISTLLYKSEIRKLSHLYSEHAFFKCT